MVEKDRLLSACKWIIYPQLWNPFIGNLQVCLILVHRSSDDGMRKIVMN